jgi:hypothetical protein
LVIFSAAVCGPSPFLSESISFYHHRFLNDDPAKRRHYSLGIMPA